MMRNLIIFAFVVSLLIGAYTPLPAQNNPIKFKNISMADGLSQTIIFCMIQDSKGFIWFGTQDGLNKYDGYNFTVYKPDPDDPNSLSDNIIDDLCEDRSGVIWVATGTSGLNKFDPKTQRFFRYPLSPDQPGFINTGFINSVCVSRSGETWAGSEGAGLYRIIRETAPPGQTPAANPGVDKNERLLRYTYRADDPASLSGNVILDVFEDSSGVIWVGTTAGLNKFDRATGKFGRFLHLPGNPSSLSGNVVSIIYEDSSGILWVGTTNGLNRMDRETGTFTAYRNLPGDPTSISSSDINDILEDRSGIIWVTTEDKGLNRFNKRSETFTHYRHDPSDPFSLPIDTTTRLLEDNSRILWVGTTSKGLAKFDREDKFKHYTKDPNNPNSLSSNFIYSVYKDRQGILWAGTNVNGLNKINRESGRITHYDNIPGNPSSLSGNIVRSIYQDSKDTLWVGTQTGLNKLNRETGTFTRYVNDPYDKNSISNHWVRSILEDTEGNFWLGTNGGGINKMDRDTGTFTAYRTSDIGTPSFVTNSISIIIQSVNEPGILWIGTLGSGVYRFDTATGTFGLHFANVPGDRNSLSGNTVQCVHQSSNGTLWVGTFGFGLNKILKDADGSYHITYYSEKDGLPNNSIYGILEDKNARLWISTNKGLARFDTKTETFKNYNIKDGLQADEYNGGSYYKSPDGEMFFGGINGLNAFYPEQIQNNPYVPPVVFTDFKLFNKPVPVGPGKLLPNAITWTQELHLSHKQNMFSIQFAALDFTAPENNRYAFMMEGVDDDWVEVDAATRIASYSNLGPGQYTFRVKGSNNDGIWNREGSSLRIIIEPPFWRRTWFQILALMLALVLLYLWYHRRLKTVRIRAELQTAHDAQMSIMPQNDPKIHGFDISGICAPANEVGGDFFDYMWLDKANNVFGTAIGDVSGKAMKSAMTAVMTSGMIYMEAGKKSSVKEIMTHVNRPLYFKTGKKVFTALCLAAFNLETRELTFTNAGLPDPLLKSETSVSKLGSAGRQLPLGVKEDIQYTESRHQLKPGDVLLFFTDGVTETMNQFNDFYDTRRLTLLLEELDVSMLRAKDIVERVIEDVTLFSGGASQYDDITVVAIKVL